MIDRIAELFWRARYRLAKWRSRPRAKSYREQCERNGWFVAALVCLSLTAHACGPSRATRTALDEIRSVEAACQARAVEIAETAPSLDEGRRLLGVEGARCAEAGRVFCAAHHLDCSEVLP